MNYILVSSTVQRGQQQRVNFSGPTYIDYYAENNTATLLETELEQVLMAQNSGPIGLYPQRSPQTVSFVGAMNFVQMAPFVAYPGPPHGFSYNYTVNMPPLAVLEFLKTHGYKVVGTNTIGDTCMWTLHKETGTTDRSTPQSTDQSTPQTALRIQRLL